MAITRAKLDRAVCSTLSRRAPGRSTGTPQSPIRNWACGSASGVLVGAQEHGRVLVVLPAASKAAEVVRGFARSEAQVEAGGRNERRNRQEAHLPEREDSWRGPRYEPGGNLPGRPQQAQGVQGMAVPVRVSRRTRPGPPSQRAHAAWQSRQAGPGATCWTSTMLQVPCPSRTCRRGATAAAASLRASGPDAKLPAPGLGLTLGPLPRRARSTPSASIDWSFVGHGGCISS